MKVKKPTGKILFKETQQFRQAWLWAIIISGSLIPLVLVSVLLPQDKNITWKEASLTIALIAGISCINIAAFYLTKLETVVTEDGLFYRWRPYRKRYSQVSWEQIATITVKKYPYLKYGYHSNRDFGKVHTIDGNRGILFELVGGKRVYIGTQKLPALQHTLEHIKPVMVQTK